jgi:sRNA-binding protein
MLEEAKQIAQEENRTMSELLREALRTYQQQRRWKNITEYGAASAKAAGVKTEEDVVHAIHQLRASKRHSKKRS